ncbi:MAG: hypothetical protein ACF8R9_05575 [Phycisphaerales bacterium JB054]
MNRALFSFETLANDHRSEIVLGHQGKLACLWYDRLIMDVPDLQRPLEIMIERGQITSDISEHLLHIWTPPPPGLPGWNDSELYRMGRLGTHDRSADIDEAARGLLAEHFGTETHEVHPTDVGRAAAALLCTIQRWEALCASGSCTLMANELESRYFQLNAPARLRDGFGVFSQFADALVPNLADIPWERIFELREHPHIEACRQRLADLDAANVKCDVRDVAALADEILHRDLVALAHLVRPRLKRAVTVGFFSSLPSPLLLNPVSVASSAAEISRHSHIAREYGWMYFMLDMGTP